MRAPPFLLLKRLVDPRRPITYGIVQAGDDVEDGVPYVRPADMHEHNGVADPAELRKTAREVAAAYARSTVRSGDLVVSIGPSYGKTMVVPTVLEGANLTQGTARVAPAEGVDRRFLRWALRSSTALEYWDAAVAGATFRALNLEPLSRTPIPVWEPSIQTRIADFLDAETVRIDALIEKKRRMIWLMEARSFSLLSHSLVRPGWRLTRLGRFASVQTGLTVDSSRAAGGDVVTRPYLRVANVLHGRLALDTVTEISVSRTIAERTTLRTGDVLMTEGGDLDKLGRGTVWRNEIPGCLHQNHVFAVRTDPTRLNGEYLALLTQTGHGRAYFERTGSRITNLASTSSTKVLDFPVPIVPVAHQRALVDAAAKASALAAEISSRLTRQIDLLLEHREALITAAVTGQLGLTKAAA